MAYLHENIPVDQTMVDNEAEVKKIQRTDPNGKAAWMKYVKEFGGDVRDPAKHDPDFLQYFISQYQEGGYSSVPSASSSTDSLAAAWKDAQRSSPGFKQAWATFQLSRGKKNDPNLAGKDAMVQFLDFLGQQGMMSMSVMGCGGGKGRGIKGGCAEPLAKRARIGGMSPFFAGGMSPFFAGDPVKTALVDKVKEFQRSSDDNKLAWWAFADGQPGKNRDPARHDTEVLQMFLSLHGLSGRVNVKNQFAVNVMGGDPVKTELVNKVKEFQRSSDDNKLAWWAYADELPGKNRDPARHDTDVLQTFLSLHGVSGRVNVKKEFAVNVMAGDPVKTELVGKIKEFQRSSEDNKQAWWAFADGLPGKNRDPARHDKEMLQMFLSEYTVV